MADCKRNQFALTIYKSDKNEISTDLGPSINETSVFGQEFAMLNINVEMMKIISIVKYKSQNVVLIEVEYRY